MAQDHSGTHEDDKKGSLFGKFNTAFQHKLQTSRGEESGIGPAPASAGAPSAPPADELAMRRGRQPQSDRMIVPEGVVIEGSLNSRSETEISGRIDGDVMVEGRLWLGGTSVVTGNVRTLSSRVEGNVEGKMECSHELDLGETGRLSADAIAGKSMTLAGEVKGNVTCGGLLRLLQTAKVTGNIRARSIVIEEGAMFNGQCLTPGPKQKAPAEPATQSGPAT